MEMTSTQHVQTTQETAESTAVAVLEKHPWQEPKLAFVEPQLTLHGELHKVTGGFFGTFTPPGS
jgi:hypothetical protein